MKASIRILALVCLLALLLHAQQNEEETPSDVLSGVIEAAREAILYSRTDGVIEGLIAHIVRHQPYGRRGRGVSLGLVGHRYSARSHCHCFLAGNTGAAGEWHVLFPPDGEDFCRRSIEGGQMEGNANDVNQKSCQGSKRHCKSIPVPPQESPFA